MMKKISIIIFALLMVVLCLASCKDDGVPSGMKVASNTACVDYSLFVPKSWIIDSMDKVSSAHVSDNDSTGISVKINENTTYEKWWDSYKSALESTFKDLKIEVDGESTVVASLNAKKYTFTASFLSNSHYKYELYAIERNGSLYEIMIKYQGNTRDGTVTYTDEAYKDDIKDILDNFCFNDKLTENDEVTYEAKNTPQGMECASDDKIVDYHLFVPSEWVVEKTKDTVSSAYVSEADKTNVSVMQWNVGSYNFDSWWNEYKLQLYSAFDYASIPLDNDGNAVVNDDGTITFKDSSIITVRSEGTDLEISEEKAEKYTYSIKIQDKVYDFDVYAIMHRSSVYVMTFTFESGCDMSLYQEDIDKILSSFRFV